MRPAPWPAALAVLLLAGCAEPESEPGEAQIPEDMVEVVEVEPPVVDAQEAVDPADEEAAAAVAELNTPRQRYERYCHACHATGAAGSPRMGVEELWRDLYERRGMDGLVRSVVQGSRGMPRRGMCMECTEDELTDIVRLMLEDSGVEVSAEGE